MIYYMAIANENGFTVGRAKTKTSRVIGNICRTFKTFNEADKCAKKIALGEFEWKAGIYVNNR